MSTEKERLEEDLQKKKHWKRWGPYLSERQWGTVREDDSEQGDVWNSFSHDQSRSRAYRWGEDGIAGISDTHQRLCFAMAFWNGEDPILKERLFGLTGQEGNHGEDVKEVYFYLDNTPTHSYMHYLYKYPHHAFPYERLVEENKRRSQQEREYELFDTGIFGNDSYFDISIEYAKIDAEDLAVCIKVSNRGKERKKLFLLPTLWFRNTWSFGKKENKPTLQEGRGCIDANHLTLGRRFLYFQNPQEVLFTENESNLKRLFGLPNPSSFVKDAFHEYLIHGVKEAINRDAFGTKSALVYSLDLASKEESTIYLRLSEQEGLQTPLQGLDAIFLQRKEEADAFYEELFSLLKDKGLLQIQRQACAGMLWNKQFYHYVIEEWLKERDPKERENARNKDWVHLYNEDILSVPDKWEYPCFFSWDTAFHCLPLALLDVEFSKRQLTLLTREWYMHPNGQVPSNEWTFSDVNPPVHAWAAWRIYKIEKKRQGREDRLFLERIFQKLLLNFTWWVNRKDAEGKNVFQGGFLGLDNISIFNRNEQLPKGGKLYQSDATSWMGMYCLNMLTIALELAKENSAYEDMASKFFEHFLYIADAINYSSEQRPSLWNEEDGFYYDMLSLPGSTCFPLKIRSMVGIIPLFAVATLAPETLKQLGGFQKRFEWFMSNRTDLCARVACMHTPGEGQRRILAILNQERLKKILQKVLSEEEFLSPYGIRSLSKYHQEHPYSLRLNGEEQHVSYDPAESTSRFFGGNSNWRGPIWFPLNILIIESLQKFHHYFGAEFKVECPIGSGKWMDLWEVSLEISRRLTNLFVRDKEGKRPMDGGNPLFQSDPYWKDHLLFYEYFHGEKGEGLGASHQCGWTALVAKLIQQLSEYRA